MTRQQKSEVITNCLFCSKPVYPERDQEIRTKACHGREEPFECASCTRDITEHPQIFLCKNFPECPTLFCRACTFGNQVGRKPTVNEIERAREQNAYAYTGQRPDWHVVQKANPLESVSRGSQSVSSGSAPSSTQPLASSAKSMPLRPKAAFAAAGRTTTAKASGLVNATKAGAGKAGKSSAPPPKGNAPRPPPPPPARGKNKRDYSQPPPKTARKNWW